MPIPSFTPFSIGQGLQFGLDRRRQREETALAQQRIGLSQQELAERRRSSMVGEGQRGQELDISRQSALGGLLQRAEQLAEERRAAQVREGFEGKRVDLEARARAEAERAAQAQEAQTGRRLTEDERANLTREAIQREEIKARREEATATRGLREREIGISERSTERRDTLAERGQGFEEKKFGAEFGFQQQREAQRITEEARRLGISEAELKERIRAAQVGESQGQQRIGLEARGLTERERSARAGEGLQAAQLQFQRLEAQLKRAVEARTINFEQAKALRDEAFVRAKNGQDLQKWLTEQQRGAYEFDMTTKQSAAKALLDSLKPGARTSPGYRPMDEELKLIQERNKPGYRPLSEEKELAAARNPRESFADWWAKQQAGKGLTFKNQKQLQDERQAEAAKQAAGRAQQAATRYSAAGLSKEQAAYAANLDRYMSQTRGTLNSLKGVLGEIPPEHEARAKVLRGYLEQGERAQAKLLERLRGGAGFAGATGTSTAQTRTIGGRTVSATREERKKAAAILSNPQSTPAQKRRAQEYLAASVD